MCPACEDYRDKQSQPALAAKTAESAPDLNKNKPKLATKSTRSTKNKKVADNCISAVGEPLDTSQPSDVADQCHAVSQPPKPNNLSVFDLEKQVNDLKLVVEQQKVIINSVVGRLNFVLSMFSIEEVSLPSADPGHHNQWPDLPSRNPAMQMGVDHGVNHNTEDRENGVASHPQPPSIPLLSSVVGRKPPLQQPQQLTKFRQSIVAAVYLDQREKDRRASSFIISGLPVSNQLSDQTIVAELCSTEFSVQVEVTNTKRLGQPSANKIQPLLVNLKNAEQAKNIISSARKLRQSSVPHIKDNVFINANLTKAEATAAYELRCRHRSDASRRTETHQPGSDKRDKPDSYRASVAPLDADVPPFVPSSSSSATP